MKYLMSLFIVFALSGCNAKPLVRKPSTQIYDNKKTNYVHGEISPLTPTINIYKPKKKKERR